MKDLNLAQQLQERFKQLPKAVQKAITSADVEKHLRTLADTHKLHLDQWQLLENNVMLTLLGFQPFDELASNIKNDINISQERADEMAGDISKNVFEPIRQELERELAHPDAKAKEVSSVDTARQQTLAAEEGTRDEGRGTESQTERTENGEQKTETQNPIRPEGPIQPTTTPELSASLQQSAQQAPATTPKAVRMPTSGAYKPGEPSAARKDIHDDPYREPPA